MIVDDAERVGAFVGSKIGAEFSPPFTALGIERDGEVVSGFVFNGWTGPEVQISLAVDGGMTRTLLRRVAQYVWDELGCIRATVETEQKHVADLALRMGGQVEGVKRNLFGPGRDGVVFGILKEDWFLRGPAS